VDKVRTVFREDFSTMPVGTFPYDYTPLGEYHMIIPEGFMGNWRASTNHSSWRRKECSPWNILVEEGKGKVLEQATIQEKGLPTITAGEEDWSDLLIWCSFRPLSLEGPIAVLFRYQNSRQYYAFWYTGDSIQLVLRDDREFKVIAEKGCQLSCDQYHNLEILAKGEYLKVVLADKILLASDDRFSRGKIALAANSPVRYNWVEVRMEENEYQLINKRKEEKEWAVAKKRRRLPEPVLWRRLATPGFGAGKSIRFGDLDNDGQLEILLAQNVRRMSKDSFSEISCLTALDLEGNILWQLGEANPANGLVTNDLPFQIHDIDSDGKQEVVLCKDFRLQVLNGSTGKLKYDTPTPVNPEGGFYRINGDAIYFCDLSGNGLDNNIILKDRYSNLWAYTWDLKLLWQQSGNIGHYPMAYDIDGDGKKELLIGYNLFDQDGTLLWNLELADHADGVAIGRFGKEDNLQIIIAASDEGLIWVSPEGEIMKHFYHGHCQTVTAANLIPEREGLEIVTVTFWGNPGIIIVYDEKGNLITRKELITPWGSALSPVNWSGNGQEHILLSTHPRLGGMIDGYGHRVVSFPDDGHPYLCCEPIDLTGDSRDEIVTWDTDSIWIYTQDSSLSDMVYKPKRQPHYNMSNYRAQLSFSD
jgi:hypothetical protein